MLHLKQEVCGYYKIEAVKKTKSGKENKRLLADWFPNIIPNPALDQMFTSSYVGNGAESPVGSFLKYCMVGTGDTAPAVTDTTLETQLAVTGIYVSHAATVQPSTPYYRKYAIVYRFNEGVAEGTISEVGVGWYDNPNYNCFSRALILNDVGSPTTITVGSDEYLDISYEYRIYPKETDSTGSVTFTGDLGDSYDWTIRLATATLWPTSNKYTYGYPFKQLSMGTLMNPSNGQQYSSNSDLQAITASPTNIGGNIDPGAIDSYVAGNYYSIRLLTVPLTTGNIVDGIRSFRIAAGSCYYQIQFDPKIPKTATDILTFKFKLSWGRKS